MTAAARPSEDGATRPGDVGADPLSLAVGWSVRLASGTATDDDRRDCAAWRAARAEHEAAWQRVQQVEAVFAQVPAPQSGAARRTLDDPALAARPGRGSRPRAGRRSLGIGLLVAGLGGWLAARWPETVRTRVATAAGERRTIMLDDGTRLQLDAEAEVEVALTAWHRTVRLLRGAVFLTSGPDPAGPPWGRPLRVETARAVYAALGTAFGVRHGAEADRLDVVEGRVAIQRPGLPDQILGAGQAVDVRAGTASTPFATREARLDAVAWRSGMLVVRRLPLDEFVAELGRYGAVRFDCDDDVAALPVSGVFQLDGSDPAGRALAAVARTLPIRVVERGPGRRLIVGR